MVISSFGIACRPHFCLRTPPFHCIGKVQLNLVAAMETLEEPEGLFKDNKSSNSAHGRKNVMEPVWKKLNPKELGITTSMIDKPTRKVLNGLKRKGYEVYLVGGCVRDLILNRTSKDFDIITSAELKEVTRTFSWCEIVGKRFPICHVRIGDTVIEVSSFSISAQKSGRNLSSDFGKPNHCDDKDYLRWRNCSQRDFTINGLMFDPYARIVYTTWEALKILEKLKVLSSKETAHSVKSLSYSILRLDKGRLLMEMNYMLAYGSAEASLRILWKFGLLELLLPIQAAYFARHGFRRRDKRTNMLLGCDLSIPDHNALSEQPRDSLVVAALSLAIHNGGDLLEAVSIAKRVTKVHDVSFHELIESQNLNPRALRDEVVNLAASLKRALNNMTDEQIVSQAMAGCPQAPYSDLVLIPWGLSLTVCRIFSCVTLGAERGFTPKQGSKIDYESLAEGALPEVRHIFARVVFDTVYPLTLNRDLWESFFPFVPSSFELLAVHSSDRRQLNSH